MKITVTGAAGRLGHAALTALTARGLTIHATDRKYRKDTPVPIDVANLLDRDACYHLVEGSDVLVHLGNHVMIGEGGPQTTYSENCTMNINIVQAAVEVGVKKIIYASSIQVMGGERLRYSDPPIPSRLAYLPADGNLPANATNAYSLSKRSAEDMLAAVARVEGLQTIALRFPLLITKQHGEHLKQHPWKDYPKLDEAFAYLCVEDAGELIAAIVEADLPGFRIYLPATRGTISAESPQELIKRYFPNVPLKQPAETLTSLVDISQITRDTGWTPKIALFD